MRHGKKFNHLGRKKGHRRALLKNMACSLIEHKRINTTIAKAKALRLYVEPLITKGKNNTTHSRRVVFSYLQNKEAIKELFGPIADKVASRPGGYVRIIRTGFRKGDGAEMAMIELVDYNNDYSAGKSGEGGKAKKRRSRRGGAKKTAAAAAGAVAATTAAAATVVEDTVDEVQETVVETVVEETPVVETAAPEVTEEVVTEKIVENVGDEDPELAALNAKNEEDSATTTSDEEE